MKVRVDPLRAEVGTFGPAVFTVEVYNTDNVIRSYDLQVLGVDPAWYQVNSDDLALFPETSGYATILVDLPRDVPAGEQCLAVQVTETTGTDRTEIIDLVVDRWAERTVSLEIHPPLVVGGRRGRLSLVAENTGNAPIQVTPAALDLEDKVATTFSPPSFPLEPRQQQIVEVAIRGPRPLIGSPEARTIALTVDGVDLPTETTATFVQKPWLGRGLVALLGLLVAASVFTVVLAENLGDVVDEASVDDAVLIQALEDEEALAGAAAVPATIGGAVTEAASGEGVAGVTVELYDAGNPEVPVKTAATDESGAYQLGGVGGGTYKVRFVGAGFSETWYEGAATFDGATEVEVEPGGALDGLDAVIGGQPGEASGLVIVDDPVGAVATLVLPAEIIDSETDAVVATVNVASDGTFVFEQVPAPATYRLEITKPGYAREIRMVTIDAAEVIDDIEVLLREGDGQIGGVVNGPDGPIGGVTITATDGTSSVITSSLTSGSIGSFTLRDLVTPGSYTVTASRPGFRDEVTTVVLDEGQEIDGVSITLASDTGSISGRASAAGGGPLGGVTVTVTDGDTTLFTTTLSTGDVGAWSISGLPSPGTYTVTFSHKDLVSQTRSVDLDPLGANAVTGINASLRPIGAVIKGTVSDENGKVGGVEITISDGSVTLSSRSADRPLGSYEIRDVPPGTYTVTFSRPGSTAQTVLATVAAGETRTINITVATRASISGTVRVGGQPARGAQVLLYQFDDFPLSPLRTVTVGESGTYAFPDLVAPQNYVVEVAATEGGPGLDSVVVQLTASQQAAGTDFDLPTN